MCGHLRRALARAALEASNLRFGPEVGVSWKWKTDWPLVATWLEIVNEIAEDLERIPTFPGRGVGSAVHRDARELLVVPGGRLIDAVITSPPYPNERDCTRIMRLETVLHEFAQDQKDMQAIKRGLVRSNTRGVYKADLDDVEAKRFPEVVDIAERIEARRIELGETSGFERLFPRLMKLYFGGMYRHFKVLRGVLRPGAQLAYVVGDQASYLRVMIRTGRLLAEVATSLGCEVERNRPVPPAVLHRDPGPAARRGGHPALAG